MNTDAMLYRQRMPTCTADRPVQLFGIYISHHADELKNALAAKHYEVISIRGGVTGELQIMDTHINRPFKSLHPQLDSTNRPQECTDNDASGQDAPGANEDDDNANAPLFRDEVRPANPQEDKKEKRLIDEDLSKDRIEAEKRISHEGCSHNYRRGM